MNIDPLLRQRILISLGWLIKDAQWRFDQTKDADGLAGGGYSPELQEAMRLLEELESASASSVSSEG
jgi:hypothetical protein